MNYQELKNRLINNHFYPIEVKIWTSDSYEVDELRIECSPGLMELGLSKYESLIEKLSAENLLPLLRVDVMPNDGYIRLKIVA